MKYIFHSTCEEETIKLGEEVGKHLRGGEMLALSGDLGSGKTYFTKGVAKGLGVDCDEVVSPTYTLVNEYEGRIKMYHSDFYRIDSSREIETTGLCDFFGDEDCAIIVEWAEKVESMLPEERLKIFIRCDGEKKRNFEFVDSRGFNGHIIRALKGWSGN